jgi:TrmH family RNA methyltransferase
MVISSRSNAIVKEIRFLRQRKAREATGTYLMEGIRLVAEAVRCRATIELIISAPDLLTSEVARETVSAAEQRGVPVLRITPDVFGSISLKEGPQGIAALVRQRWEALDDVDPDGTLCWIVLDEVADPGNLGTILRTGDAVGAAGVILLGATTDPYDPASVRASMGAILSQRMVRAGMADLEPWKRRGVWRIVGTSDAADTEYTAVSYEPPLALLMGSERHGLTADARALCDAVVRIPMVGHSDSLNLAVAAGVMLYEIFNRSRSS